MRCTHAERKELLGVFRRSKYEWCLTCGALRLGRTEQREEVKKEKIAWEEWSLPSNKGNGAKNIKDMGG